MNFHLELFQDPIPDTTAMLQSSTSDARLGVEDSFESSTPPTTSSGILTTFGEGTSETTSMFFTADQRGEVTESITRSSSGEPNSSTTEFRTGAVDQTTEIGASSTATESGIDENKKTAYANDFVNF